MNWLACPSFSVLVLLVLLVDAVGGGRVGLRGGDVVYLERVAGRKEGGRRERHSISIGSGIRIKRRVKEHECVEKGAWRFQ